MIAFSWDEEKNCVVRTSDAYAYNYAEYIGGHMNEPPAMWRLYNDDETKDKDYKIVFIGDAEYPYYEQDIAELVLKYKQPIRILDPTEAPYNEHSVPYSVKPVTEYEASIHEFLEAPVDENGDYMDFTECDDEDIKVSANLTVLADGSIAIADEGDPVIIYKGYSLYDMLEADNYSDYVYELCKLLKDKFEACSK